MEALNTLRNKNVVQLVPDFVTQTPLYKALEPTLVGDTAEGFSKERIGTFCKKYGEVCNFWAWADAQYYENNGELNDLVIIKQDFVSRNRPTNYDDNKIDLVFEGPTNYRDLDYQGKLEYSQQVSPVLKALGVLGEGEDVSSIESKIIDNANQLLETNIEGVLVDYNSDVGVRIKYDVFKFLESISEERQKRLETKKLELKK